MSREFTKEEIRDQFLKHMRLMVQYWAQQPGLDVESKCDGIVFSMLTAIDGAGSIPPFYLTAVSDAEYQDYCKERGENFYPLTCTINEDVMLHEEWSRYSTADLLAQAQAKTAQEAESSKH